jgi:hypothetical protein
MSAPPGQAWWSQTDRPATTGLVPVERSLDSYRQRADYDSRPLGLPQRGAHWRAMLSECAGGHTSLSCSRRGRIADTNPKR